MIRLLWKIYQPRWFALTVGIVLSVMVIAANISLLTLSGWFISSMALAGLAGISINYFTPAAIIRFLAILRTGGRYAERLYTHDTMLQLISDWRLKLYENIEPQVPDILETHHATDLLTHFSQDIDQLDNFYLRILLPVASAFILLICISYFAFSYHPPFAILLCSGLLVSALLIPFSSFNIYRKTGTKLALHQRDMHICLTDQLTAFNELRLYQLQDKYTQQFLTYSDQAILQQKKQQQTRNINDATNQWLTSVIMTAAISLLSAAVVENTINPAQFAMLAFLALASFEATATLPLAFSVYPQAKQSLQRIHLIFKQATKPVSSSKTLDFPEQQDIHFKQLAYQYKNTDKAIFSDFNLTIKSHQITAIVGSNGSGKSTLFRLLCGFAHAADNQVSINNTPINSIADDVLRQHVSLLRQQQYIFDSSVLDNLTIANPDATLEDVQACCRLAKIHDTIMALPHQYNSWIGDTGITLSGGEKQRLALARVYLRNSSILLLDEPTESLDTKTERQVLDNIRKMSQSKTTIIITHKPQILAIADHIVWLEKGEIHAQGSYQDLMQQNTSFRHLYSSII